MHLYKHDTTGLCSIEFARGGLLCTGMKVLLKTFELDIVGHRRACWIPRFLLTLHSSEPPAAEQIFCGIIVPLSHGRHLDGWCVWSRLSTVVVVVVQRFRTDRRKLRPHYYLRSTSPPLAPHGGDSGGSVRVCPSVPLSQVAVAHS